MISITMQENGSFETTAGRTRGTILFSAQQFKSATDYRLQENIDIQITAKLGLSELSRALFNG